MGQTRGRRRLVATVGGASALVALAWLVSAFDSGGSGVSSAASSGVLAVFELVVPLVVLLLIAGLTWFLLTKDEPDEPGPEPYVECASCGRSILREWRLCPYCGSRSARASMADDALASGRDPAVPQRYDGDRATGPGALTHTKG